MPESARKRCLVALDATSGPVLVWVDLPADATVEAALAQARRAAQADAAGSMIDWNNRATGIWGVRCERSAVPRDGDRIELYLPLPADPRERRRQRAANRRPSGEPGAKR